MLRRSIGLVLFLCAVSYCRGEEENEASRIVLSGRVVDEQSEGVEGIQVRGLAYTDSTESTTDAEGRFILHVLETMLPSLAIVAEDGEHERLGVYKANREAPPNADTPIEIILEVCRDLPVEVADAEGKPAAGAVVGAIINYAPLVSVVTDSTGKGVLKVPPAATIQTVYAMKRGVGFDYRIVQTPRDEAHRSEWLESPPIQFQLAPAQSIQIELVDAETESPLVGKEVSLWLLNKPGEPDSFNFSFLPTEFRINTDETGIADFKGVPTWHIHPLTFWPNDDQYERERITFDPQKQLSGKLRVKLNQLVPMSGQVRFADGQPAAEISVSVVGVGHAMDSFRQVAKTDKQGHFELQVAPNLLYMLAVQDEQWAASAIDGLIVRPQVPIEGLEISLQKAIRVFGRVTVGQEDRPVVGQRMSLYQAGRALQEMEGVELPNPENTRYWVQPSVFRNAETDEEGRYEFLVGPGKYTLSGPTQVKHQEFEIADETEFEFNFASPRPEKGPFAGQVVTGDPQQPVAGAIIEGKYRTFTGRDLRLRCDEQGRFAGERQLHRTVILAKSPDGKLAGIVEIGPDEDEVTITIGPLASATARLLDDPTDDPLPDTKVQWGHRVHKGDDDAPWETAWGGIATTDTLGKFEIKGLVVGEEYHLNVPRGDGSYGSLTTLTPETAEPITLGNLRLKPPYKPPTFEERMAGQLATDRSTIERYEKALKEAEKFRQHVLVVFLDSDAKLTKEWFKQRLDEQPVRSALADYQLVQVATDGEGAQELAEQLGIALDEDSLPVWRFSDPQGKELEVGSLPRSESEDDLDQSTLLESLARHAPKRLNARELIEEALAEAKASNRRIFVQETATWCGPCHMLSDYLERERSIWEKDYVWVLIDLRWKENVEVMNEIKEGYRGGVPWFAILDSGGKVLATSEGPDGNIGFPSDKTGIDHFLSMLDSTKQRMSAEDIAAMRLGWREK